MHFRFGILSLLVSSGLSFNIYIDGSAGTTGLQVRERLSKRSDINIISIPDELRKDEGARKEYMEKADAVVLCLPDEASKQANEWLNESGNDRTILIDASTAFRVDPTFTYGFPELSSEQKSLISKSRRISNPGCYPTGFLGLTRPLVDAGIVPKDTPLTINAISGYSGGGKQLMEIYEGGESEPWGAYGFGLAHKHVPEMTLYSGLSKPPIFHPAVGSFPQGMVVSVPLHYEWLKEGTTGKQMHEALKEHYAGSKFISVKDMGNAEDLERGAFLRPDSLANTNKMELFVFANDDVGQTVLCARLDNLGKGASGAAVQNMNLALGLPEDAGL